MGQMVPKDSTASSTHESWLQLLPYPRPMNVGQSWAGGAGEGQENSGLGLQQL